MRGAWGIALLVALFVGALPATARADATPWDIGAAKADTTPPAFDAAQDLQDFPETDLARGVTCPRAVYSGVRLWRFEEPYQDTDGSGAFSYPVSGDPGTAPAPEPFCDYNHNGRWDGIYLSGGSDHQAKAVHDRIDARAAAFSDGTKTVVVVSVIAQGIFENYIAEARAEAEALAAQGPHASSCGHIDEMVVSSNHNESSPDTVGIYGAPPDPTGAFGLNSSIDEYYMDWLDSQMAEAAVEACDNRRPAALREVDFPVPQGLKQEIPRRFPTETDDARPAAIDPKVRVLEATGASGEPIFTMMNLADHNQDIGQSDDYDVAHAVSGDWPGYFHRRLEADVGGMAMFLVGDNGSQEDLITDPSIPGPPCFSGANGCYAQVEATGNAIADHVAAALPGARPVRFGPVVGQRSEFCAPLENNLFRAAFEAGLFGERQGYTDCQPTGRAGTEVHTSVAVLDVGPDLQFLGNPGESFPALMLGGPWGIEDASCANRPNPPVPTWRAHAEHRFQVGLADDMVGYEKPSWSFLYDTPGTFTPTDCTSDPHGHSHALEDEAVGPTAGNLVAEHLSSLLDQSPDPTAEIRLGRYVKADGTLTDAYSVPLDQGAPGHFPTDAVAIWLTDPGSTALEPDTGTIVALNSVRAFGDRPVDANGEFMDFDGAAEPGGPDVSTRGMLVRDRDGNVVKRYYVDVYPAVAVAGSLGPAAQFQYPRPKGATPVYTPLVPAYAACAAPDRVHASPLSFGSCSAPQLESPRLTLGTPDANGRPAQGAGFVRLAVAPGDLATAANEADVRISVEQTDVRRAGSLVDYDGSLRGRLTLRITDRRNDDGDAATGAAVPFGFVVPCATTADTGVGGSCSVATTANTVLPGAVAEGARSVWELGTVEVSDGGVDSNGATAGDDAPFLRQGVFVP
jgi:hypothetical protein